MKKLMIACVLVIFASTSAIAVSLQGMSLEGFKVSKNVTGVYTPKTGTGANTTYSVGTKHTSGNKNYHTGSSTTYIYMATVEQTASATAANAPGTISDTSVYSSYTQM